MEGKKKFFFSVIIPLYNKEDYVERCLKTVANQSFKDYEVVIVDDGSTDASFDVVSSFIERHNLTDNFRIVKKPNGGVSSARNFGCKISRGSFLAFIDADDEWDPDFLKNVYWLYKKNKSCKVYATGYKIPGSRNSANEYIAVGDYFQLSYLGCLNFCASSFCLDKKVFEELGGYDESLMVSEDLDLYYRAAVLTNFCFISKPLATYNQDVAHTDRLSKVCPSKRWGGSANEKLINRIKCESCAENIKWPMQYILIREFRRVLKDLLRLRFIEAKNRMKNFKSLELGASDFLIFSVSLFLLKSFFYISKKFRFSSLVLISAKGMESFIFLPRKKSV